jgi:8-oxo-dGTP diphosphatase
MKLTTLCYLKRDGKTLMIHRIKKANDVNAGKWNGLGGKFDAGETPEACIIREVYEESGYTIRNPELKGFVTFPGFANEEDWYMFVFVARDFKGEMIESDEGFLEWIDDTRIMDLNLWEGDHIFIPWLDENRFFSAFFTYKEGCLLDHGVNFYDFFHP